MIKFIKKNIIWILIIFLSFWLFSVVGLIVALIGFILFLIFYKQEEPIIEEKEKIESIIEEKEPIMETKEKIESIMEEKLKTYFKNIKEIPEENKKIMNDLYDKTLNYIGIYKKINIYIEPLFNKYFKILSGYYIGEKPYNKNNYTLNKYYPIDIINDDTIDMGPSSTANTMTNINSFYVAFIEKNKKYKNTYKKYILRYEEDTRELKNDNIILFTDDDIDFNIKSLKILNNKIKKKLNIK